MFRELGRLDALLIVDVQNDFCPGGALPVPEGDRVIPVLNRWIAAARLRGVRIYASRDWHPRDHVSFQDQGGPWPPHCIRDTAGARIHAHLDLLGNTELVGKGVHRDRDNYSAFDETGLAGRLHAAGVQRIWVGGLALDYCVLATVLDAIKQGFEVHLLTEATRPVEVNPGDGDRALAKMRTVGAIFET